MRWNELEGQSQLLPLLYLAPGPDIASACFAEETGVLSQCSAQCRSYNSVGWFSTVVTTADKFCATNRRPGNERMNTRCLGKGDVCATEICGATVNYSPALQNTKRQRGENGNGDGNDENQENRRRSKQTAGCEEH